MGALHNPATSAHPSRPTTGGSPASALAAASERAASVETAHIVESAAGAHLDKAHAEDAPFNAVQSKAGCQHALVRGGVGAHARHRPPRSEVVQAARYLADRFRVADEEAVCEALTVVLIRRQQDTGSGVGGAERQSDRRGLSAERPEQPLQVAG